MALTKIDDRGLTTPIDLLDNEKIRFGTGNDLELYHDGDSSYINHVTSGTDLVIDAKSPGDDLILRAADDVEIRVQGNENAIKCIGNGGAELYYDNSKKLETTSGGVNVTGMVQADQFALLDNEKATYGDSNDLQIYHDGSNSFIDDAGTGNLVVRSSTIAFENAPGGGEVLAKFIADGAVELYYDNVKKLETTTAGSTITGNEVKLYNATDTSNTYFYAQNTGAGNAGIKMKNSSGEWTIIANDRLRFIDDDASLERLSILSDGKIGINNTTPTFAAGGGVHLKGSSTDFTSYRVTASSNTGIDFSQASDGKGYIYNRDNADLIVGTNNSERLRITAAGAIQSKDSVSGGGNASSGFLMGAVDTACYLAVQGKSAANGGAAGNAVFQGYFGADNTFRVNSNGLIKTSAGIDFSGAQTNTAGMTSETLDHYEEGTFTPTYKANSATPTVGYLNQDGKYTKIGNVVYYQIYLRIDSWSGGSGVLYIHGLPFTSGTTAYGGAGGILYVNAWGDDEPTNCMVESGGTKLYLYGGGLSSGTSQNLYSADVGTTSMIRINGSYMVA